MGGGGSKSKSKSYSGSGQLWAQPIAKEAAGSVGQVFNANQPGLQNLTQFTQNQFIPELHGQFQAGAQGADAARNYNMDVVGGQFMNGNPFMDSILNRIRGDVSNDVNGTFAQSGRYGSGAHTGVLADSLADAESNLLFQNYSQEMARRDAAANSLNQAATSSAGTTLGALGIGAEIPYAGINAYGNALGSLFSGGTETTKSKTKGPGILGSLMQGVGAAAGAYAASDRRLKTKIELLRTDPDGLNWYRFAYKIEPDVMFEGVMADQVKKLRPQAYIENFTGTGYDGVNYAALGTGPNAMIPA